MEQQPSILKEIRPHGTKSFPCAIYRTHSVGKGTLVKHHWHEEVEILYFSGGEFRLEINMESFPYPRNASVSSTPASCTASSRKPRTAILRTPWSFPWGF